MNVGFGIFQRGDGHSGTWQDRSVPGSQCFALVNFVRPMPSSKSSVHMMADRSLHVLVTGATGKQGGTLLRQLKARGHRLRALVRDPTTPAAKALRAQGVEVVQGSFDDPSSVEQAAQLVDAAFLMGTPFAGADVERKQGISVIEGLRAAEVPFVLYSSVASASQHTGIPHFDSKFAVEHQLRTSGLPFAIVGPVSFMENVVAPFALPGLRQGTYGSWVPADKPIQMIALEDLAAFDTMLIEKASRFRGQRVEVAGDELTPVQVASVLSQRIGRPVRLQVLPLEGIRQQNPDLAKMSEWLGQHGYTVDIPALRHDYPEIGWHTLDDWAGEQDWNRLLAAA